MNELENNANNVEQEGASKQSFLDPMKKFAFYEIIILSTFVLLGQL